MPKSSPAQLSFTGGEVSPLLHGRVDLERYRESLDTCQNAVPTLQGGLMRRPGFEFINEVKDSSKATRLVEFEFSTTQAYILEFGDQYIRFYRNYGQILSGMTPVEIATPYLEADLFQLKFAQSADVLYVVHPNYAPRKIRRTSNTNWFINQITFLDGPYLPINTTATTLTLSATTGGAITITASSAVFAVTDVGRSVRIQHGTTWGWARITAYSSSTSVTASVQSNFNATTASAFWRLGLWSDTSGYPATVTFHEDRLGFGGTPEAPQRIDFSEAGEYERFQPTEFDSSVIDSNALSFTFNATDVNVVRWMLSDEKGLVVGTVGGEWIVRPSSRSEALTPTNITAKRSTTYGSADVQPAQVGKAGLFVQRANRKIREISYYFDVDGFRASDLSLLAEHLTESGVKELSHQKEPQPILWCVRNDGKLVGLTYERDIDSFKAGWHAHVVGGQSDASGTQAKVESVAVIPSPDGFREDLWIVVNRYIDGQVKRYVEVLKPFFNDETLQRDAFFVDSGLTYDLPLTITGISKADPAVVTVANTLVNGDKVLVSDVVGMNEVNGQSYLVANATGTSFSLKDLGGNDVDSSAFSTYVSGGQVRKFISNISGLDHLEGETVSILADGAVQPDKVVSSGTIALSTPATTVHIGLGYETDVKMLRLNTGAADGTALGKTQRSHRVGLMLHRSLGLKIGMRFDDLTELTFRTAADKLSRAPELFTGIRSETIEGDYDFENQICIRQDQPLPMMLLAIMPQLHTQDR